MTKIVSKKFHIICIVAFVIGCIAFSVQDAHADSNFIIEDYDVDMQVNEDDTYLITETLDVHFTQPSHGIYVVVPYKNTLYRDDQKTTFYGKVTDFKMLSGQKVSKSKGDEARFFRIGDEDKYADTDTTYKYSYVFDMKGDHLSGADEVYYNLVGTRWEAQDIEHVTFKVTFPKNIDMNNVGIKTGYQIDVPFDAEGKRVLRGETTENVLGGLTIRALLPQGYFTKQANTSNLLFYLFIAIIAVVTAVGFVLWRKYGRDPKVIQTEEFYPPKGLSAPEVAYLESGNLLNSQITSLLLTLADKGYLKISETEEIYGRKKNKTRIEYELIKLKEYDGDSEDERHFMEGLFEDGETKVEVKDLKNSFYKTIKEINENIVDRYDGKLWDERAETYAGALQIVAVLGMVALFVISKALNGSPFIVGNGDFLIYCVFDVMEIALPLIGFYGISKWINKPRKSVVKYVFGLIGWGIIILLGLGLAVLFDTCMGAQIVPYVIGMGMIFLLCFMAALCERKTDYYVDVLGKIRGYKDFLQVAEKDRMEKLAERDPQYFYKNLAFAYALGVTSVYVKHFAALATQPPEWYYSAHGTYTTGSAFDSIHMMDSVNNMMSSVGSTMTSSPSSGGGGSFSGGGGAGGSGGGSW